MLEVQFNQEEKAQMVIIKLMLDYDHSPTSLSQILGIAVRKFQSYKFSSEEAQKVLDFESLLSNHSMVV
jgi:hypothetical protein